jgi:hypothetical protein
MSTIIRAANTKGSYYGDSSFRTADIRRQAILGGQAQKTGDNTFLSAAAQAQKPLIAEHHLTKGKDNGVREVMWIKNNTGIF